MPILYWDTRKGLIKEVISQQRSKAARGSMWISGGGTVLKRDNSQRKDPERRECLEGSRNSKEASVAGTEGARGNQKEVRSESHRGTEAWSFLAGHFVFSPVCGGEPRGGSEPKSKLVVFYCCCN